MTDSDLAGSCLCGTVTFSIRAPMIRMLHCHCSRCRKATGTGHATNILATPKQLTWHTGEDRITRFDLPNAKSFSKWFCQQCGSPVPRVSRSGLLVIPAGSLDTVPDVRPTDIIYWASRAPWACSSDGLKTHAEFPESL